MAKLTRYLQKIFANNSNQVGVFGTGVDKETSKNVETLQSADYEDGWSSAVITDKNYPIWQEMDGVQYGLSYQLKYLFQNGIPEWLSTETYYTNSYCRYGSDIYYSLQDDNTNHNPALNDGWWIIAGGADRDLSNLSTEGNAKLQYAPFAVNEGTITSGENTTLYFPPESTVIVEELPWTQPTLSANGTMGGGSFAVAASNQYGSNAAWYAFDNNNSTYWQGGTANTGSITFYNPTPLKVTSLFLSPYQESSRTIKSGNVQGSNDNSDWTTITSWSGNTSLDLTVNMSSNTGFYNYYKINITGIQTTSYYPTVRTINITGVYQQSTTITAGTEIVCTPCKITTTDGRTKEFDSIATIDVSTQADGTYSVFKDYTDGSLSLLQNANFEQPTLSADGTLGGGSFAVSATSVNSSSYAAYMAFDNKATTQWLTLDFNFPIGLTIYNPVAICCKYIQLTNRNTYNSAFTAGTVYGSNNNSSWTEIKSFTNSITSAAAKWYIDLSSNTNAYKYYKIEFTDGVIDSGTPSAKYGLVQVNLNAVYPTGYNLDSSTVPANLYVDGVVNNDLVLLGTCTISSGIITNVTNVPINNGWKLAEQFHNGYSVVERYQNGTSWYRIYSDGWCDQGAVITGNSQGDHDIGTLYFLKTFPNTDYMVTAEAQGANLTGWVYMTTKTVNSVFLKIRTWSNNTTTIYCNVRACGYLS